MSEVELLLTRCWELGIMLTPTEKGTLRYRSPSRLPDDLRESLREHKEEIITWLRQQRIGRMPPELLAALETEEAMFRTYWRTLPDKALAKATWPSTLIWFCTERGVDPAVYGELRRRCSDLKTT